MRKTTLELKLHKMDYPALETPPEGKPNVSKLGATKTYQTPFTE